jgi:hypothetical protein
MRVRFCLLLLAGLLAAPGAAWALAPSDLVEFDRQPPRVQRLIRDALALAQRGLRYQYGSNDPARGGLDCSGCVQWLLQQQGYSRVPRTASDQCAWLMQTGRFRWGRDRWFGVQKWNPGELQVGDLVFWSGTYRVRRNPPVTHVMIYLGTRKSDGKRVIMGSTDGRRSEGVKVSGARVYDFPLPGDARTEAQRRIYAKLYGFGSLPGMR